MATVSLRHFLKLRDRASSTAVAVALAFAAAAAVLLTLDFWPRHSVPYGTTSSDPNLVDLTLLENAEEKGALCLDGSPPGYHLQSGFGSGSSNWLIHQEGGGWCQDLESCDERKKTHLGSSNYMDSQIVFGGILSRNSSENPDFYNWNKVMVRYCDGASFSGNVKNEVLNGTTFFFRGQRIWDAIMEELLSKGLSNANQALLTGCSAGGLATFIHCDDFFSLLPKSVNIKCFADAGFFLDVEDISRERFMRAFYNDVVNLQCLGDKFPDCVSKMEPGQCLFPKEIIKNITTPFFILNTAYDSWQVQNVLAPDESDPQESWLSCKLNITKCDSDQMKILQGFRDVLLENLREVKKKKEWGIFVNSCFTHCQTLNPLTWHSPDSPRISNKTIAEAVGDWYFDRREVKEIDCPYPCNPTCYNIP